MTTKTRKLSTSTHANGAAFTEKRPGVVATIIDCLRNASSKAPTTKDKILATLTKRFPEREPVKMKATISGMVSWLRIEKGIVVSSNDEGYWIKSSPAKTLSKTPTEAPKGKIMKTLVKLAAKADKKAS